MSLSPQPWAIHQACRILDGGGIIAYPTEAVWGLGCDPWNEEAVFQLCELKQRKLDKGLIIVASDITQLQPFIRPLSEHDQERLYSSWPGAVTWLLPVNPNVPDIVTGGSSVIAVRVSAHPTIQALCQSFGGAIISSSANPSGKPPAKTSLKVRRYFSSNLDYVLNGELGGLDKPTKIIDLQTGCVFR